MDFVFAENSFHPLKAGRRPFSGAKTKGVRRSFHPLKAGRRRYRVVAEFDIFDVSIPSRRVGDTNQALEKVCKKLVSIPSRRVGDTILSWGARAGLMFPSPQGGSETMRAGNIAIGHGCFHPLKAGRRRFTCTRNACPFLSFHPLKAGRRPCSETVPTCNAFVSIPSRRVGD